MKRKVFYSTALAFIVIVAIAVFLSISSASEQRKLLEDSIKSQLIAICNAANEMVDVDEFISYDSVEAAESDPNYAETLQRLRSFCDSAGAEYIYALAYIDGECLFIFDTDTENETVFIPYELSDVHERAFAGESGASVMNVDDEYGSFNTGAVPMYKNGKIVGIISADIEDSYLTQSNQVMQRNTILLVSVLVIVMLAAFIVINRLLGNVAGMQASLERMAHYDTVTGLPNRQYLLTYLSQISGSGKTPFAMLFIDLDNFKLVNDNAGHDAGDELLRYIAEFLNKFGENETNTISFRPAAGQLNISARIGGDEFIQVITGVSTEEKAIEIGQKLLKEFNEHSDNRYVDKFSVGMSVGIALYPYHTESFHTLVKYADIAMYEAKRAGKNRAIVYNDEMQAVPEK